MKLNLSIGVKKVTTPLLSLWDAQKNKEQCQAFRGVASLLRQDNNSSKISQKDQEEHLKHCRVKERVIGPVCIGWGDLRRKP